MYSPKKITEVEAYEKMATLCSRSEQCEYDISQKLFRLGFFGVLRDNIIINLKKHRFLDNKRFAENYARSKCRYSSWGPYKVKQGLRLKRISVDEIDEALEKVEREEWEKAAERTAIKKARSLNLIGENYLKERVKLYRFMLSRGFESSMAQDWVKIMIRNAKESSENESIAK